MAISTKALTTMLFTKIIPKDDVRVRTAALWWRVWIQFNHVLLLVTWRGPRTPASWS
jgi:hypothetical protein